MDDRVDGAGADDVDTGLALFLRRHGAWSGAATFALLKIIAQFVPLRVDRHSTIEGLDLTQHGEALQ